MPFDRRTIVLGAALSAAAAKSFAQSPAQARNPRRRRPVVLVHDSWHGGWCWRQVAQRLRTAGHPTFAPTLTGLGERAHLRSPAVGLDTHIADIAAVIECEELDEVILVGHGYAGVILAGIADQMTDRLAHAVLLDAIIPKAGKSMWDLLAPEISDRQSRDLIDGYLVRPPTPANFGVSDSDAAESQWLGRRLTPHPAGCFTQALVLKNGGLSALPKTYIDCLKPSVYGTEDPFARSARSEPGWAFQTIDSGHEAMITAPDATARLLLDIA
jgi:pimeloyl-ACP methyl ester carboxylesterase